MAFIVSTPNKAKQIILHLFERSLARRVRFGKESEQGQDKTGQNRTRRVLGAFPGTKTRQEGNKRELQNGKMDKNDKDVKSGKTDKINDYNIIESKIIDCSSARIRIGL